MGKKAFERMWPDEVADYMKTHREGGYLLVDVREEEEYAREHIPGALHLPLREVPEKIAALLREPGRELIFYCARGVRSEAAALMGRDVLGEEIPIMSMTGGIAAWEAGLAVSPPDLSLFYGPKRHGSALERAMALEKGAELFYGFLARRWEKGPLGGLLGKMAGDEVAHARILWRFMEKKETFETLYEKLDAEFTESGEALGDLLGEMEALSEGACEEVLERALGLELMAYDLYRNMGEASEGEERRAFFALAQAEKSHMERLAEAFGLCGAVQ